VINNGFHLGLLIFGLKLLMGCMVRLLILLMVLLGLITDALNIVDL